MTRRSSKLTRIRWNFDVPRIRAILERETKTIKIKQNKKKKKKKKKKQQQKTTEHCFSTYAKNENFSVTVKTT